MQGLNAAYKFTYKKPKSRDFLPNRSYIRQRDDEDYFFYRLDANNYISLDVLLKLYHSQILRLSIGQQIQLINMIYKKIVSIYLKDVFLSGTQIGELTLENIWIYTEQGFNGQLNPQKDWQIIFLNYHDDQHVKFETNQNKFSLIQDHIIKVCKDTEFKIRAKLYDNKLFVDQFIDVLDDLFYDFQQLLYSNIDQVDKFIQENVNELQETEYEYNNEDTEYISQNFEKVVNYLNQIYKQQEKSQSEFDQHIVLLKWQEGLYNFMIESNWNRQGYQMTMELLNFIKTQIIDNRKLSNFGRKELENKTFQKMENLGFFNFNSQTVRLAKILEIKKQIKYDLTVEDNHLKKYEQEGKVYEKYMQLKRESKDQYSKAENEKFNNIRDENQDLILNYYRKYCQDQWALYTKFYFSINLYNQWNNLLVERLNLEQDQTIKSNLKKILEKWFSDLMKENKIGDDDEENQDKHD